MKNWLKTQATEVSAWAGLALILSPLAPDWVAVTVGILCISIDDQKAANLAKSVGNWVSTKLDELF
jgi:hypothetical protein